MVLLAVLGSESKIYTEYTLYVQVKEVFFYAKFQRLRIRKHKCTKRHVTFSVFYGK